MTVQKSPANPDFIISMMDGKLYKTLHRHLSTHGMTPDEYRPRMGSHLEVGHLDTFICVA